MNQLLQFVSNLLTSLMLQIVNKLLTNLKKIIEVSNLLTN